MYGGWITKNGKLVASPSFTPYILTQVMDLPRNNGLLVDTVVDFTDEVMFFHRGLNGYAFAAIQMQNNAGKLRLRIYLQGGEASTIRIYLFSRKIVKIPDYGLFFYKNGSVIFHDKCLPLFVKSIPNNTSISMNGKFAFESRYMHSDMNPDLGRYYYTFWGVLCSPTNSRGGEVYFWDVSSAQGYFQSHPPTLMYIETEIYDQYYQQALGY
ncbi:hypothetical protein F157LOC_00804 [Pectobacterium brasiliense]|uniref:hypothetical protein n=1 Tax=Pectobacterium brasiliense TaxID=180957 RepID=UPI000CE69418|nr:hypothetical protein [Pectobacterium brasiliense]PPE61969.1 hypothetical protein F157LOC_00804 [Pectobacterium brasiliense]